VHFKLRCLAALALSRQLNLDNGTLDGALIVRKVAAGPPAPTHRGAIILNHKINC